MSCQFLLYNSVYQLRGSLSYSVVSDSLRPHGLQPARLLCPWDSPGKNAGVDQLCVSLYPLPLESSRGPQLLLYPWRKTRPPLLGVVVLFDWARSFGRDARGAVRKEGDTHPASQIGWISPGDQGVTDHNQIALTSYPLPLEATPHPLSYPSRWSSFFFSFSPAFQHWDLLF